MGKPGIVLILRRLRDLMPVPRRSIDFRQMHLAAEIAAIRNEAAALRDELAVAKRSILRQRRVLADGAARQTSAPGVSPAPTREKPEISACLKKLQELAPHAFPIWKEVLEVNASAYLDFPIHSCSVEGHPMAELFRCFLKPYLRGAVLDIGCGPQPVPYYFEDYPVELIAGIDPLLPAAPHPFVFVQGVAEFLPWEDRTFSVVVVGTSLDHVLLLDRALAEIRRVLKEDGHLIAWVSLVPGAAKYDPYSPGIEKVDDYHLFHFDRPWFEELLGTYFGTEECFSFVHPELSCFYSFRPR